MYPISDLPNITWKIIDQLWKENDRKYLNIRWWIYYKNRKIRMLYTLEIESASTFNLVVGPP
jgi:hypothetical protein